MQRERVAVLPEFAAGNEDGHIASESFGRGGAIVIVRINPKFLAPGSDSECGWVCDPNAPVEVLCIIDRRCIDVERIKKAASAESSESREKRLKELAASSGGEVSETNASHQQKKQVEFWSDSSESDEENLNAPFSNPLGNSPTSGSLPSTGAPPQQIMDESENDSLLAKKPPAVTWYHQLKQQICCCGCCQSCCSKSSEQSNDKGSSPRPF